MLEAPQRSMRIEVSVSVVETAWMRLIIVGFGTVGQAFARTVLARQRGLLRVFGLRPRIVAVVDRGGAAVKAHGLDFDAVYKAKLREGSVSRAPAVGRPSVTAQDVIEEVDADVVVEVSPTNLVDGEPGLSHIETALKRKRHVITANKGPLAHAFPALMELAAYNRVLLRFSGSVGGGTPILDLGKKCLLGDTVLSIHGILNGTTNYILTRMFETKTSMATALREAQDAGYAEADPTSDVEGLDAACKLVILANWVMDRPITLSDVNVRGIREIDVDAVARARDENCVIKLIASITDKAVEVKPQPIPRTNPLNVGGVLNAVTYRTMLAGEITIIGHGAGGRETASSMVRDLIDIRRSLTV
jgi:homoserine dehydrogenase